MYIMGNTLRMPVSMTSFTSLKEEGIRIEGSLKKLIKEVEDSVHVSKGHERKLQMIKSQWLTIRTALIQTTNSNGQSDIIYVYELHKSIAHLFSRFYLVQKIKLTSISEKEEPLLEH